MTHEESVNDTEYDTNLVAGRWRKAREMRGWSQRELAERSGVSRSTIARVETGETTDPSRNSTKAVSDATGASLKWLRTGEGEMRGGTPQNVGDSPTAIEGERDVDLVPVYDIEANAGPGGHIVDEKPIGHIRPSPQSPFFQVQGSNGKRGFYIVVHGDSMHPTLSPGEIIPVRRFEPALDDIREDAIYVYRYDKRTFVKRLRAVSGSRLRVVSDNKAYQDEYIDLDEGTDFAVLGQVLKW